MNFHDVKKKLLEIEDVADTFTDERRQEIIFRATKIIHRCSFIKGNKIDYFAKKKNERETKLLKLPEVKTNFSRTEIPLFFTYQAFLENYKTIRDRKNLSIQVRTLAGSDEGEFAELTEQDNYSMKYLTYHYMHNCDLPSCYLAFVETIGIVLFLREFSQMKATNLNVETDILNRYDCFRHGQFRRRLEIRQTFSDYLNILHHHVGLYTKWTIRHFRTTVLLGFLLRILDWIRYEPYTYRMECCVRREIITYAKSLEWKSEYISDWLLYYVKVIWRQFRRL